MTDSEPPANGDAWRVATLTKSNDDDDDDESRSANDALFGKSRCESTVFAQSACATEVELAANKFVDEEWWPGSGGNWNCWSLGRAGDERNEEEEAEGEAEAEMGASTFADT